MRDIKFRIYFKAEESFMSEPITLEDLLHEDWIEFKNKEETLSLPLKDFRFFYSKNENYEIMEYTGLKDKNGKEIYEGDIVKLSEKIDISKHKVIHIKPIIAEISWSEEYLTYVLITTDIRHAFENVADYLEEYNLEVIGNIYDNPELLEKGAEE